MTSFAHHTPEQPKTPRVELVTRALELTLPDRTIRAKLTTNLSSMSNDSVVLCPGLSIGMGGSFVTAMESLLHRSSSIKHSIRFNFSGHPQDQDNFDIRGYTLTRAVEDYCAAVRELRAAGSQRITAICSSAGTQAALLAACSSVPGGERVDHIIGRGAVVDCFSSVTRSIPSSVWDEWVTAGSFKFPLGKDLVVMGSDLLTDLERWIPRNDLTTLTTPVTLIHGDKDEVIPLEAVRQGIAAAPAELVKLVVVPGAGHTFEAQAPHEHLELIRSQFQSLPNQSYPSANNQ